MSHDDTELVIRRALRAAAPADVDAARVVADVGERVDRRRRRRGRRRVAATALGLAALTGAVVMAVERPTVIDTATEPERSTAAEHPTSSAPAQPDQVVIELPGAGERAAIVATDDTGAWFTRGDRPDAVRSAPDSVSRVDVDGTVGPTTELRGVAVLGVADDRRLWLLVDERPDLTDGSWRLKRVDRDSGELEASYVVEIGARPGDVRIEGDHVLVSDATTTVVLDHDGAVVERRPAPTTSGAPVRRVPDGMTLEGTSVELRGR